MRIVIQRAISGCVEFQDGGRRETGPGIVALIGICPADDEGVAKYMAAKTANLRIFSDDKGNMNLSLLDTGGGALVASNFTLYADCRKGRRPSFAGAAEPARAEPLYELFIWELEALGVKDVIIGKFGADMRVEIINDGPVTIILDSDEVMPGKRGRER